MEKGFIKLSRKFFSHELWEAARTFSECEAWLDLIQSARFDATRLTASIGGREITYGRGQYPASIRFLAKRWKWGDRKVRAFIEKLVKEGMVTIDNSQGMTIITLVNYDDYNTNDTANDTMNDTDNVLNYSKIKEIVTQVVTQQMTQLQQERHSNDTKKKKEKKDNLKESPPNGGQKKAELSSSPPPSPPKESEKIDWEEFREFFNKTFSNRLSPIQTITEARKKAVKARIAEHGKEAVLKVFEKILESKFLLGNNNRDWRADFDWIFRPNNFIKILEGNYDSKNAGCNSSDDDELMRAIANGIERGYQARKERGL